MKNNQIEIKTPLLAESIEKAIVLDWHYSPGDFVEEGVVLVELETDKVVLEVPAPTSGVIDRIIAESSAEVKSEQVLAMMVEKEAPELRKEEGVIQDEANPEEKAVPSSIDSVVTPSARKQAAILDVKTENIAGSGKKGRIIKEDIVSAASSTNAAQGEPETKKALEPISQTPKPIGERTKRAVPISRLRARVAERLLQSQHQTATLTTFNEANMQAVMDLRKNYQDQFVQKYGIKLGFMSFFTIASVHALQRFPTVNAYFENDQIIYHDYCDIGIAMSTERGLMVPILKNVETMNFADVESGIVAFAQKAKQNKIDISDLQGGTFSITNGGIFGSLLSTPILNPPQSAILGLHAINPTPIVENNEVVVRPVMKLALSYDHRIIDGREAVSFLVVIKQMIENPVRMLFGI